ncbi:MAG: PKD domain-containing protein [Acidobacteriota bacterium]
MGYHVSYPPRRPPLIRSLLLPTLVGFLFLSSSVHAQLGGAFSEEAVLLELYQSTDGPNWANSTGWLDEKDYCSWYGVTCDAEQSVVALELGNNGLAGEVPASLGDLKGLATLSLQSNELRGFFPAQSFSSLTRLDLRGNGLEGTLAQFALPSLVDLLLGNSGGGANQFTGTLDDLDGLLILRRLDLHQVGLTGTLEVLQSMPSLTYVDVGNNSLGGSIPTLSSSSLQAFLAAGNQLSGSIPGGGLSASVSQLEVLDLSNNLLQGSLPNLSGLASLRALQLSGNEFTGSLPALPSSLSVLDVSDNELSGIVPSPSLTQLKEAKLSRNRFSGSLPELPAGALGLLWVDGNRLEGAVPQSYQQIAGLRLGFNKLGSQGLSGAWSATQTVSPEGLVALTSPTSVDLQWETIEYVANGGSYRVYDGDGGKLIAETSAKTQNSITVTGLTPGQTYSFVVTSTTGVHGGNPNALESDPSSELQVTLPGGAALNAAFDWAPSGPDVGESVQFTDSSSGGATQWLWSFGDGSFSAARNPTHVYTAPDTYEVTLQIERAGDGAQATTSAELTVASTGLQPDFSVEPATPVAGAVAQFVDESSGNPSQWLWSFGDGATSTEQNPTHVYQQAGQYDVSLTVSSPRTAQNQVVVRKIEVLLDPDFGFDPAQPAVGEEIDFVDETVGGAGVWRWTFGDGTQSQLQNPQHAYSEAGVYTVQLRVGTEPGASPVVRQRQISVGGVLLADFEFSPSTPCTGETVQFVDRSSSTVVSHSWDFGDGSVSDQRSPTHVYTTAGDFTVTLTVEDSAGDTSSRTSSIRVESIDPQIAVAPTSPVAGEPVTLTASLGGNVVPGSATLFSWDLGDGSLAAGPSVSHTFESAGDYAVVLTAQVGGKSGTAARVVSVLPAVGDPPLARFAYQPKRPLEGESVDFFDQSLGEVSSWAWNFGDGTTSDDQNPSHSFASAGAYDVTLQVAGSSGSSSFAEQVVVLAPVTLQADFGFAPPRPEVGAEIRFVDQTSGFPTIWAWDFGDGAESSEQNPRHVYSEPGAYEVRLRVTEASGASDVVQGIVTVDPPPARVEFARSAEVVAEDEIVVRLALERSGDLRSAIDGEVVVLAGTAVEGVDYAPEILQFAWRPFETAPQQVSFRVFDDAVVERSEFAVLRIAVQAGAQAGERSTSRLVIVDDDLEVSQEIDLGLDGLNPSVASFSGDGRSLAEDRQVVVFESSDGSGAGVFARTFDRSGDFLGPVRRIDRPRGRLGEPREPQVAIDRRGFVSVVWQEQEAVGKGAGNAVGRFFGQIFDTAGVPTTPEDIEIVDPETEVTPPSIDVDNGGEVVVVWREGPRVIQDGIDPLGEILGQFSTVADAAESVPQVGRSSVGGTIVVWKASAGAKGNEVAGLFGQRLTPAGQPDGEPFLVDPNADASNPAVAVDDAGGVAVVWEQPGLGGTDLVGRMFDPTNQPLGPPFVVPAEPEGEEQAPGVDSNSDGDLVVTWEDPEDGRPEIAVFDRRGRRLGEEIALGSNSTFAGGVDATIADDDTVQVVYTRGDGRLVSRLLRPALSRDCPPDQDAVLCLREGRFDLRVNWRARNGDIGPGRAERLTDDTGYFTFFDRDNIEVVAKVLDGCAINGRYWLFATGLTDVEANLVVTDTATGASRNYSNPTGADFAPIVDVNAFEGCEGPVPASLEEDALPRSVASVRGTGVGARSSGEVCGDAETLCLRGGRYQITAEWTARGDSGVGTAVQLTADTGAFTFFDEANVEVVVKALDGCGVNASNWVFAGGLTDVAVVLTVTDTFTGQQRVYRNEEGVPFVNVADTAAFSGCSP